MMKKKKKGMSVRSILEEMITTNLGTISSKIVIGAVTYILVTLALIILMFVNPSFVGLDELVSVLLITSASLLGLTTIENIKNPKHHGRRKIEDQTMHRRGNRDIPRGETDGGDPEEF